MGRMARENRRSPLTVREIFAPDMREAKDPFSKKGESEDGRQATKTDATIANELINKKDTGTRLDSGRGKKEPKRGIFKNSSLFWTN